MPNTGVSANINFSVYVSNTYPAIVLKIIFEPISKLLRNLSKLAPLPIKMLLPFFALDNKKKLFIF